MIISYTKLLNNYLEKSWKNTYKLHEWYSKEVGMLEGGNYYGNQ